MKYFRENASFLKLANFALPQDNKLKKLFSNIILSTKSWQIFFHSYPKTQKVKNAQIILRLLLPPAYGYQFFISLEN